MLKYKNIVFDFGNVIAEFDETYLIHTFHLNPNECFFIDDSEDNIETGKLPGMNGIQFTGDIAAVKSALEKTD